MRISDWSSDVCSSDLTAEAPLDDAVIAVTPALWHDMTVNTMIPAPAEESFKDGYFHFSYGPLDAGERLHVKIDGQINPPLFAGTRGEIAVFDGDRRIGARSEEHTSELQSLMRISYAVFGLKKKNAK